MHLSFSWQFEYRLRWEEFGADEDIWRDVEEFNPVSLIAKFNLIEKNKLKKRVRLLEQKVNVLVSEPNL